jgi:hypothetical protein
MSDKYTTPDLYYSKLITSQEIEIYDYMLADIKLTQVAKQRRSLNACECSHRCVRFFYTTNEMRLAL